METSDLPTDPADVPSRPTGSWCTNCNTILRRLLDDSSSEHLGTISTLLASAQTGCQMCCIITAEIQESYIANGNTLPTSTNSEGEEEDEPLRLRITDRTLPMKIRIGTDSSSTDLGHLVIDTEDPGLPLMTARALHSVDRRSFTAYPHWSVANASSEPELMADWVAVNVIAWMERCKATHGERCNRDFGGELPTRLIQIPEDGTVRLVRTDALPESERQKLQYVSVSHVWGTAAMLKLTQDRLDDFKRVIPFYELPRKFQEIIVLAGRIGIKYVWIDTMCIIQDSRADWRREAGRMADVYRNAAINLAAVGGSRDDICLTARNILGLQRASFSIDHPEAGRITLYLSRSNGLISDMFNLSEERPPALRRAWIWQERFLSRRTVYLGAPQIAWECGDCLWLESTGFTTNHYERLAIWTYCKRTIHGEVPQNWNFLPQDDELGRWKSHWDNFIAAYSDAGLTYGNDKLAAVAGIARHYQQESGQRYVGGMWVEQIPIGSLLWHTTQCLPRPPFRGAPSWSWAAVDGKLSFGGSFVRKTMPDGRSEMGMHVPRTEVVRLDVTPAVEEDAIFGWNPFAVLQVRGRLFLVEYILEEEGTKIDIKAFVQVAQGEGGGFTTRGRFDFPSGDQNRHGTYLDAPIEEQLIWACVLSTEDSYLDGLLLSRSPNGFRRLGMFNVSYRDGPELAAVAWLGETVVALE